MANRPNTLWPVGTKIRYSDAWGRNPVDGSITKHYGEINVLVEDTRGVVHFGPTWRIATEPPRLVDLDDLFSSTDDLLV